VALEGDVLRHVRTVLRLAAGDSLTVTDGTGREYRTRIERIGRDAGRAAILESGAPARESPLRTVLAQAVPKGDRFALVLQKAVELGVSEIIPVATRRTVPLFGKDGERGREGRWRRIVEGAVAQSGRTLVPLLHPPRRWEEVVAGAQAQLRVLLWEGAERGLDAALGGGAAPASVLIAVGPEGGWAEEEVGLGREAGFVPARLGPRILRTETVALAALAVLQERWGDLG
jgi:16S rRNA (uracil1498-N3)-methyltransferase